MNTLSFSELRSELLSIPADTKIHLFITADFCDFAVYSYICAAVDALVILPLFGEHYFFKYIVL